MTDCGGLLRRLPGVPELGAGVGQSRGLHLGSGLGPGSARRRLPKWAEWDLHARPAASHAE
eukprot:6498788-Alexandrium_andersonii.AAC.1